MGNEREREREREKAAIDSEATTVIVTFVTKAATRWSDASRAGQGRNRNHLSLPRYVCIVGVCTTTVVRGV